MSVDPNLATRILMATGYRGESDRARALEIQMWAAALHEDTTLEDALQAIAYHRGNVGGYLEPVHVNRLTAKARAARLNLDTVRVPVPEGLGDEPAAEIAWQRAWLDAVKAGDSDQAAQERAWAAIGRTMPKQIESTEKHDVKSALEEFKRQFGKKRKSE